MSASEQFFAELNTIIDECHFFKRVILDSIYIAIFIICVVCGLYFGEFWYIVVGIILFSLFGKISKKHAESLISVGYLAYKSVYIMYELIQIKKGKKTRYGVYVCTFDGFHHCDTSNVIIYKEFIKYYPSFKCYQLYFLSKYKYTRDDMFNCK